MTSARYLWNWIKEAGRGHVTAFLSWGGFFIYIVVTIFALQSDSYSTFSGIGSESLLYLSMGLGVLAAAATVSLRSSISLRNSSFIVSVITGSSPSNTSSNNR